MLSYLNGKEVTIYFIDGYHISSGTIQEADDRFLTYKTSIESHIIPITSIRNIVLNSENKPASHKIGF
jgi:hypothetical protein